MEAQDDLINLVDSSDFPRLPNEIVEERKRGWMNLFLKFDQPFLGDAEFSLDNLEGMELTKPLVEPAISLKRSKAYEDFISEQSELALEVATQCGNLEPASDEEDIGDEEESEDDESDEEDFLISDADTSVHAFSSPQRVLKDLRTFKENQDKMGSIRNKLVSSPELAFFDVDRQPKSTPLCVIEQKLISKVDSSPKCRSPERNLMGQTSQRKFTLSPEKRPIHSRIRVHTYNPSHRLFDDTDLLAQDDDISIKVDNLFNGEPRHVGALDAQTLKTEEDKAEQSSKVSAEETTWKNETRDTLVCASCAEKTMFPVDIDFPSEVERDSHAILCDRCLLDLRHKDCLCESCTTITTKATWRWILLESYHKKCS